MAGRKFVVAWRHTPQEVFARYRAERDGRLTPRWHGLWLLRQGRSLGETAALVGVAYRTVQEWVQWYRRGGLEEVAQHRRGGLRRVIREPLAPEQLAALVRHAATVGFATQQQAVGWAAERFGVQVTRRQMERLFRVHRLRSKVPRPLAEKADLAAQAAWKGGASSPP
jgi:transposase